MNEKFSNVLLILLVLVVVDAVFNQGRVLTGAIAGLDNRAPVSLGNQDLVNSVPISRPDNGIVIDASAPATVIHSNPLVVTATPPMPQVILVGPGATPPGPAAFAPQYAAATPTAISPYAPPEGGYTVQFLQDCTAAFRANRRANPRCPANSAEMLAGGGR